MSTSVPVSFDQVMKENAEEETAARPHPETHQPEPDNSADFLISNPAPKQWGFGKGNDGKPLLKYVQYELSVVGRIQWFALVGEFLDKAMSGDNAIHLGSVLSPPTSGGRDISQLKIQDFKDADVFVQAIGKLLIDAPDFLTKSICIWLSVPDYEWDVVAELMKQSPTLGGLSDDTFEGIVNLFIDQNFKLMKDFFRERVERIRRRYQVRLLETKEPRSQKR